MSQDNSTVSYRDIPGFPGYRIGSDGSVWSRYRKGQSHSIYPWQLLKQYRRSDGYCSIRLKSPSGVTTTQTHRLVLRAFVGPKPPDHEARHLDGNGFNNALSNLCWSTHAVNNADRVRHGTMLRGSLVGNAKLSDAIIAAIRAEYASGHITQKQLAEKYGVSQSLISLIVQRRIWAHIA